MAKGKYLVVIPFFSGGAQGRELEYAVAGWIPALDKILSDYYGV